MGKNEKLRLIAKSDRDAGRAAEGSWGSEHLPPSNEHGHCKWYGPTCELPLDPVALVLADDAPRYIETVASKTLDTPKPDPVQERLPLCTLPQALRVEQQHRYDTVAYPFAELIGDLIRPGSFVGPLHKIHESPEVQNWLAGVKKDHARPYTMRRNYVDKRYKSARAFQPGSETGECYVRFLREMVRPIVYAGLELGDDEGCTILYQRDPNFRCHLPNTGHLLVHKHCDADYHHQQNEINFWLPLTRSFGNNTLWSESAPGREDFHPFELELGEMMQFWGNQCTHYTVPNDTDHTRITVDFRVIPLPQYAQHSAGVHAACFQFHTGGKP